MRQGNKRYAADNILAYMNKPQSNIYQTALMVTILSSIERFLGFLYRIILSRTIGGEGMGLYQIALSLFAVFVTAATSGIPITVSRLITKYKASGNRTGESAAATAGIITALTFALPIFFIGFFGRNLLSAVFADGRCINVFLILLPGLIFTSVYAVLRGAFWGNRQFFAYSVIELIEEAVMITLGTFLVLSSSGAADGAIRAAIAVTASYIVSFSIAAIYFMCKGGKITNPRGSFKPLLSSAVPITAMRTSSSLINSLIAIILPARLMAAGMTSSEALSEFGMAFGMAVPVLFIPSTIIGSISLVLVPELSENYYRGKHAVLKSDIERALKTTSVIACTLIPMLFVLGEDMGVILYSNAKSGEIISRCCLMLIPLSFNMISTSMLNSLHLEKKTLLYYAISSAGMLAIIFFLPALIGAYALTAGMFFNFTLSAALNLRLLNKTCVEKPKYLFHLLKTFLCVLPAAAAGKLIYSLFNKLIGAFFSMCFTAVCMAGIIFALFYAFKLITFKPVKKLLNKKTRQPLT